MHIILPTTLFLSFVPNHNFNKFLRGLLPLWGLLLIPPFVLGVLAQPPFLDQSFNFILQLDVIVGVMIVTLMEMRVLGLIIPHRLQDHVVKYASGQRVLLLQLSGALFFIPFSKYSFLFNFLFKLFCEIKSTSKFLIRRH